MKTYVHTKICTQMFTAALFITAKNRKQSRCPSMGEWAKKMEYLYHRLLPIYRKECTIDILNNLDESPENYAE